MHIAVIGMGTMGAPMARNLLQAGHNVVVYNRTRARADALMADGAKVANSPLEAAIDAEVILICVSDTPDVEEILFQEGTGVVEGAKAGSLIIDCSTIAPSATRTFAAKFAEMNIGFVDAPVSGGSEGAINATLAIMCGGSEKDMERAMPVLQGIGKSITHVGPSGAGQVTKAINQIAIAGTYRAIAEGLALASKAGVDPDRVVNAIAGGAAASWVLDHRSGNMIANDYPLGFRMKLHRKDLNIALQEGKELGVSLALTELVASSEDKLIEAGYGDEDMSAIARGVREESGMGQEKF
ncbi:MAG: 3-hydroxyisobutyrate dehydrogenase [Planctomycetota bacterium]|jgi:3-hydroxyisobutyrate dehydrogenase